MYHCANQGLRLLEFQSLSVKGKGAVKTYHIDHVNSKIKKIKIKS